MGKPSIRPVRALVTMALVALGVVIARPTAAAPSTWPDSIAVLPVMNYSLDGESARHLLETLHAYLPKYGYSLIDPEKLTGVCRDLGVRHGADVKLIDPRIFRERLSASYLLVPALESSNKEFKLIMNARYVEVGIRLVDTATGATVHANWQRVAKRDFNADPVNAVISLFDQAVSSREVMIDQLVRRLLQDIPGPLQSADNLLDRAEELP